MWEEYYNKETKTLIIPFNFNEELKDLPLDTEIIILEEDFSKTKYSQFNQLIDDLPNGLTYLSFGYNFNQKVDNLPTNLIHLTFGNLFNKEVDNLPSSLTHLTFGHSFNKKVDNLPKKLIHLTFGTFFN